MQAGRVVTLGKLGMNIHFPGRCCRTEGCSGKIEYFCVYETARESEVHLRCKECYEREDTGFTKVGSVELLHLYLLR